MGSSKSKKTAFIMIVNVASTIIASLCSLIVTSKILLHLGSDYNGVNSTATQIVTILGLIEGGFTLASQVALYSPVADGDIKRINAISSYTSRKMMTYGIYTFLAGIAVSAVYACFIKSELDYVTILAVMVLSVATTAFNLGIVCKYRLIFQVTQTEYKYGVVNIGINILQYVTVFIALDFTDNIILVRFIYFTAEVLKGLAVIIMARKEFRYLDFHQNCSDVKIKGTKDVFVAKITALFYNSAPVLFISTFIGTSATSVYAVYLSITNIILTVLSMVVNAPTHGIGQLIVESEESGDKTRLTSVFKELEVATTFLSCLLCSVTFVILVPFISLYTAKVSDISYVDNFYAIVMVLITLFQIMHIPSGICMNVSGSFKAIKITQIIATVVLIISMGLGVWLWGLKGLLLGKLLTSITLCALEIGYAYKHIIKIDFMAFVRVVVPNYIVTISLSTAEYYLISHFLSITSWIIWIAVAVVVTLINLGVLIVSNLITNRISLKNLMTRVYRMVSKNTQNA